ncbi:MAG: hypothetical protein JF597_19870 [Streptomyces sp.]|nr:hypothetical protein [Streptomyces sp.]
MPATARDAAAVVRPRGPRTSGWTKDSSWSSSSVSFTLADRDRPAPGKVLYDDVSDDGGESAVTVSMAQFRARACRDA